MATLNLNIIAEGLGKSMANLSDQLAEEVNAGVRDVAFAGHAHIISELQKRATPAPKRAAYLEALQLRRIHNGYIILLDGQWANYLEEGVSAAKMRDILLSSKKLIDKGTRSGKPWVRMTSKGVRFASVPFQRHPFSKDSATGDLDSSIQSMRAINAKGRKQKITSVFKDSSGQPIQGKAAVVSPGETKNPFLRGLTKYQNVSETGRVSSVFLNFRTLTDNSSWKLGEKGYNLFKDAEKYIEGQLEKIVTELL